MQRRWKIVALACIGVFAVAQLIRPERANPSTDPQHVIQAQAGAAGLGAVLDRSCADCHSHQTVWPWYTQVAPVSWAMAYGVKEGRRAVNFSEWAVYPPARRQELLDQSCRDVTSGRMPGSAWTLLHPEARLSAEDIATICTAAHTLQSQ